MKTPKILIHSIAALCFPALAIPAGTLGTMATQNANAVNITGGTASGMTVSGITMTSGTNSLTFTRGSVSITVSTGGTLGTAAYTGSSSYAPSTGSASIVTLGNVTSGTFAGTLGSISGANLTGIAPAVGALTGAGNGITAALGINTGSAGSIVVNGGAGGTPASLTLTNATGLPATALTGGTLASGVTLSSLTSTGVVSTGTWSGSFGSVSGANLTGITVAWSALTGTTLASGIVTSSLTSTGVVSTGTWSGSFGSVSGANLTTISANNLSTGTLSATLGGTGKSNVGTLSLAGNLATTGTAPVTLAAPNSASAIVLTIPTTTATLARTDAANTFTGTQTFSGAISAGAASAVQTSLVVGSTSAALSLSTRGIEARSSQTSADTLLVLDNDGNNTAADAQLDFGGLNSTGAARKVRGRIAGYWTSNTTGSEAGGMKFSTLQSGTTTLVLTMDNAGAITLADGVNLIANATTGTKVGTATSQKWGFWNATPITQPTRAGQLTDNSGGTSGGSTIAAIADGSILDGTQNAGKASTANAVATLAARINLIEGKLSAAGGGSGMTASLEPRNVLDAGGIFALLWCAIRARRKKI